MHVTGQGYTVWSVLSVSMGWGSVDGGAPGLLPNNDDYRTGVTFWARIGDTSSNKVRFAISDKYSRPEGGYCIDGGFDGRRLLRHVRRRPDPAGHHLEAVPDPVRRPHPAELRPAATGSTAAASTPSSSTSTRSRLSTSGSTTSRSTSRPRAKRAIAAT